LNGVAHAYDETVCHLPRIPDVHLQAVVFIYPSREAAKQGQRVGGSGFVVEYPTQVPGIALPYVVTNGHVIDSGGQWVRFNIPGGTYVHHVPPEEWLTFPPDDFATAPLNLPFHVRPYAIPLAGSCVDRDTSQRLRLGQGDEIYMVGRFIGHGGRESNNPVARFGNISLMPSAVDPVLDGRRNHVEAYLVEMRSRSGFSGSPVFTFIVERNDRGQIPNPTNVSMGGTILALLGIDTGHKVEPIIVKGRKGTGEYEETDLFIDYPSDLAIVSPTWKITDRLERQDAVDYRSEYGLRLGAEMETELAVVDAAMEEPNRVRPLRGSGP